MSITSFAAAEMRRQTEDTRRDHPGPAVPSEAGFGIGLPAGRPGNGCDMSSDPTVEFDCADCGLHVVSLVPPHNPARRCAGCQWLLDTPHASAPEKAALRQVLIERGVIG